MESAVDEIGSPAPPTPGRNDTPCLYPAGLRRDRVSPAALVLAAITVLMIVVPFAGPALLLLLNLGYALLLVLLGLAQMGLAILVMMPGIILAWLADIHIIEPFIDALPGISGAPRPFGEDMLDYFLGSIGYAVLSVMALAILSVVVTGIFRGIIALNNRLLRDDSAAPPQETSAYAYRCVYVRRVDEDEVIVEKPVTGFSSGAVEQELRKQYPGDEYLVGDSVDDEPELDEAGPS